MKQLSVGLVLALVALAGCQPASKEAQTEKPSAAPAAEQASATTEAATTASAQPVTLSGTVGCGHCNFGKTSECSAAIQTADGNVTVIDGVTHDSELWKLREENATPAEVTGTVAQGPDGLQHMQMASYKIL
jgi:hypothetical protein